MTAKETELFKTKVVKAKDGSEKLFEEVFEKTDGPVTCLGMEFKNDVARRKYFTEKLKEKLKDPEFRKIEGFPIGEDEDILALSDPPYYTACPNPWIKKFIKEWENQKPEKPKNHHYHREPFAADVSEGKNDPIYNAHSYHTKVPHKAIIRYILHYTEPGDIVFDGFCGTGMTGVAAQMCGDRSTIESLGYKIKPDGTILQQEETEDGKKLWKAFSKLGSRKAVLNDLSPAATFIAHNFNSQTDVNAFKQEATQILIEIENEHSWMYETLHSDGNRKGKINYTVWSDVFICPECTGEVIFWNAAVDKKAEKVQDKFDCPHCKAELSKRNVDRSWTTQYDPALNKTIKQAKQQPVIINYTVFGIKGRFEKSPDEIDLALIEKIQNTEIRHWYPINRLMHGKETRRNDPIGITHTHHFYTKRNLIIMAAFKEKIFSRNHLAIQLGMWFTSSHVWGTRLNRLLVSNYFKKRGGVIGQTLQGTLYVSSISVETNLLERFRLRIKSVPHTAIARTGVCETSSTRTVSLSDSSIDYLFVDPPFGSNLMYSELNSLWEGWLRTFTNNIDEAIENSAQKKDIHDYRKIMSFCFNECHRILKSGSWMTVEFSNTKATVWNTIQTALSDAGFIVSNVSVLEKNHKGYRAVTTPTAVKQDLVISAYKPNGGFEKRFISEADSEEGVWDFIRTHLKYLPVIKKQNLEIIAIPERDPRILFDQVVAYYIRKGFNVPISSKEFQLGLEQRFPERDGMSFLPEQVAEYDKKKMAGSGKYKQIEIFVSDESSAIEWLRRLLKEKPQTTQDILPQFIQVTQRAWKKSEQQVELSDLLDLNFLCYDGKGRVPSQIHSYLSTNFKDMRNLEKDDPALMARSKNRWYVPNPNEAEDREKVREKSLLKDFEQYKQATKKLKVFRLEAMRAGFKKAYQEKEYQTIIDIAKKIAGNLLEEDQKLLMWYDQAVTRTGNE